MALDIITSNAGIRRNTDTILSTIAFTMTRPRSIPIPNSINIRATIPEMVVKLEEEISGIALLKATVVASVAT